MGRGRLFARERCFQLSGKDEIVALGERGSILDRNAQAADEYCEWEVDQPCNGGSIAACDGLPERVEEGVCSPVCAEAANCRRNDECRGQRSDGFPPGDTATGAII
jgi:hypothetical protein